MKLKKIAKNNVFRIFTLIASGTLIIIFLLVLGFIIYNGTIGFINFGADNILGTTEFDQTNNKYSFWLPFSISIITSIIALIIAVPIGINVAIFIKFRIKKKYQNKARIIFETLSGIPSVIYGMFAVESLGKLFETIFDIQSNSVFVASVMLCFMVLPTIISMTLNKLHSVSDNLLLNPIALGNNKSRAIYKVYLKAAKQGIFVAVLIAFSRAIGETMAISMILQSSPSSFMYNNGFWGIINSSYQTIGSYISNNMFNDLNPEKTRPLLYAFGIFMFLFSIIINFLVIGLSRSKKKSVNKKIYSIETKIYDFFMFIPHVFINSWERLFFKSKYNKNDVNQSEAISYAKERIVNYKLTNVYSFWKLFWEYFSIIISCSFLMWIIGDILVNGVISWTQPSVSTLIYTKNTIGQSFFNSLLVILVTIVIGFPIALLIAIFLNEYSRDNWFKKIILFFIDCLNTTPSILFGMFGLLFFIQTLGLTNSGVMGNSLISGVLTLVIVILPSFIRLLEQSLKNVNFELRINSYALGNTKFETIRKIVLRSAFIDIVSGFILSIGRILSETAPLYLTAGLSSSSVIALDRPGTTLTTHIYTQMFSSSPYATNIQYEAAILTLIIVFSLVLIGYHLIPNYENIKRNLSIFYSNVKMKVSSFFAKLNKNKKNAILKK